MRGYGQRAAGATVDALEEPQPRDHEAALDELSADDRAIAQRLIWASSRLKNGRINIGETSRTLGVSQRNLRRTWSRLAGALGHGPDFLAFWRSRAVETLVGLAADLLRDRGLVAVHDEPIRRRPDPRGRLRRLRAIKRRLGVRPMDPALRSALVRFARYGIDAEALDPDAVLDAARALAPDHPAVVLWRFECAVATGALSRAAATLLHARRTPVEHVRLTLARARLLEAREQPRRAEQLLRRAARRQPGESRLRQSLSALGGCG